jgi:16S rRNA (uracil1498-N3)-methyltransferase
MVAHVNDPGNPGRVLNLPRTRKTLPRLFVSPQVAPVLEAGRQVVLDKAATSRLIEVRGLLQGDELVVFNGAHGAFLATLVDIGPGPSRKGAVIELFQQIAGQPAAGDLWFLFSPLKTGRLDYVMQKATEMGAGHIQPVRTDHTECASPGLVQMRAQVMAAAEQCEVLNMPLVHETRPLTEMIGAWRAEQGGRALVFADEEQPAGSPVAAMQTLADRPLALLIGPEGGFSDKERQMLRGCDFTLPISLGPRILRPDTAAVAGLTIIQSIIGDWR